MPTLEDKNNYRIYLFRIAAYALILVSLIFFREYLVSMRGSAGENPLTIIFLIATLTSGFQIAALFLELVGSTLLPLFLSDLVLISVIVKQTGGSSSPYLLIFPLLSLFPTLIFSQREMIIYISSVLVAMGFSVGFGPAIFWNAIAIVLTSVLGFYLVHSLKESSVALEESEVARKRLENLQRIILKNIPSGLLSVDSNGKIIQVNEVGLHILEERESELVGRNIQDFIPDLSADFLRRQSAKTRETQLGMDARDERPTFSYKVRSDNRLKRLGYNVASLWDPQGGDSLGHLIVYQDLTKVIELEKQMRTQEKLAAVGKLAAGIAHEIRNPLAGISGSAQLLEVHPELGEEDKKLLAIIQRESSRLDNLISEFLEFTRPHDLKLEALNLPTLLQDLKETIQVSPKWQVSGASLEVQNLNSANTNFLGEKNKLTQVLLNLILNSAQAGAKRILVRIQPLGLIEVCDDGAGIPPEIQKRMFEPFFTTKEKGTGLGLALSYKFIEAMQGSVSILSPAKDFCSEKGSIFRIQLKHEPGV